MTRELPPFVQDLLDRRVDPLADAAARDWLLAHPECLPAFAALRADLAALCDLAPKALCELAPLTRARRRRRLLPLGAFTLALVALVCALWRTSAPDRDVPSPLYYLIALGVLLLPPIVVTLRSSAFEARRWQESDFGDSDDDDDGDSSSSDGDD